MALGTLPVTGGRPVLLLVAGLVLLTLGLIVRRHGRRRPIIPIDIHTHTPPADDDSEPD